jgi:hypothetical protein
MSELQEYDLEFKPAIIMKGQGLFKLLTEDTSDEYQEEKGWQEEPTMYTKKVPYVPTI